VWSCIILNSITLAAACSTYFQLCGNGSVGSQGLSAGSAGFLQEAVCMRYLAPIPTTEYPKFSGWMLYAERNSSAVQFDAASAANMTGSCSSTLPAAVPAASSAPGNVSSTSSKRKRSSGNASSEDSGSAAAPLLVNTSALATLVHPLPTVQPDDGGTVMSPVFTMWCTLMALYISEWLWFAWRLFNTARGTACS
jgi:hypothetical protein